MRFRILVLSAVVALLTASAPARADYTYQFTNDSGVAQSAFNVNVGQTVTVRVYILETGGGTTLTTSGLSAAGVKLNTTSPSIATVTTTTANAAFTGGSSTSTGANASISEFSATLNPGVVAGTGADANRILVGSFTFTGLSGGQTLAVSALPGLNPDNVLGDGTTSIDAALLNNTVSAVITVAVPEPGSLILGGFLAVGAVGSAVRRFRRPAVSA
jgi:hypothetical protein